MTKAFGTLTAAVLSIAISIMPATAFAQGRRDNHWQGGSQNRHWDPANTYRSGGQHRERRLSRNDEIYRGHDGRNYCRRSDGSTGLVIGAIGGGLLGNAIGGDTLSALLGAGGGAVLGRSIDRGNVRCR
jgi:hypothetical protein